MSPYAMLDPHLRPATAEDGDFVYEVIELTLRPLVESTGRRWSTEPMRAKCRADAAQASARIIVIAGVQAGYFKLDPRNEELWLDMLVLLPRFQRQGIGSRLLADVLEQSALTGLPLRLAVFSANPARQYWEQRGFTAVREADHHVYMERTP